MRFHIKPSIPIDIDVKGSSKMGFFQSAAFSGGFLQPPSTVIGELYNQSSWSDLSDFGYSGFTPTVSNGQIVMTGGDGSLGAPMTYYSQTNDENLTQSVTFQITSAGAGIALGRRHGNHNWALDVYVACDFSSSGQSIKLYWYDVSAHLADSVSIGTGMSVGDTIRLTMREETAFSITMTAENLTTGTTWSKTVTCNMTSSITFHPPNSTQPCIWQLGGSCKISSISLSSATRKKATILCVGDSKTVGLLVAGERRLRWPDMLQGCGSVIVMAGDGDRTGSTVDQLSYITGKITSVSYIVMCLGRNDLASSVPSGTWQANYDSIVSGLKAAYPGVVFIHLLPMPENVDQSSLKSYIQSTYAGDPQVDPSVGWVSASMLDGDTIHPTSIGHWWDWKVLTTSGYLPTWVAKSNYLLDRVPGCRFAFAFRRLTSDYTGYCLQVRRSSDNTTQDIGFNGTEVDTAAILSFVGSGDGFLSILYDQTGNNDNWTTASNGVQPKIVSSGSLLKLGVKISVLTDGVDDQMLATGTMKTNNSLYCVAANNRSSLISSRVDVIASTNGQGLTSGGMSVESYNSFASTSTRQVWSDTKTGSTVTKYKNGSTSPLTLSLGEAFVGSVISSDQDTSFFASIGTFVDGGFFGMNYIREVLIWPDAHDTATRQLIERDLGSDNGITVA